MQGRTHTGEGRRGSWHTPSRARAGQGGYSLIEVLIALALVGAVVLGLAAGLLALVRTNAETAERQKMELWAGSFAESIKAAPYRVCNMAGNEPTPDGYEQAYLAWSDRWVPPEADIDLEVTAVEYWNSTAAQFESSCGATDQFSQRLSLQVTKDGRTSHAQIVKVPA